MNMISVLKHYGFAPVGEVAPEFPVNGWVHPTATNAKGVCSVLVFGNRAVIHCAEGNPIYAISHHDVEHLLRREYGCFGSMAKAAA